MMSRKKILLTGGSGFIGRNIQESFLAQKYEIIAPRHKELDLCDTEAVDRYFRENKFDFIIHSAVKPGHRNAKDLSGIFYSNTRMYFNIARHADEVERVLFIGSGSTYDMNNYKPRMQEDYFGTHIPTDEHGFSKYIAGLHIEKSKNIVDLRVFSIFGKYEDYAIRFISNMMAKCVHDLPLTMKQDRRFDFLYIDDLMPVIDYFIQNKPQHTAYNVTPDETVSLRSLAEKIRMVANKELPILIKTEGQGLEYSGDNSRLKAEFKDYLPTPFATSLPRLYSWYLENKNQIDKEVLLHDK